MSQKREIEPEFVCLECKGEEFQRVATQVKLGKRVVNNLVDLQCEKCGTLRSFGPLLPRIEASIGNSSARKSS